MAQPGAACGGAAQDGPRRHQDGQHQRDRQRHAAHPVGQTDVAVAAGGDVAHKALIHAGEHRQHPGQQHRQDGRHQAQQHRGIDHGAAQFLLQARLRRIIPGEAVQHRLGAARLFAGCDHAHGVAGQRAGLFHRRGQALAQHQRLLHGAGGLPEGARRAVLAEQAGGLVQLDARAQQQRQILAQGAHRQRIKFPFCHDASSFPIRCAPATGPAVNRSCTPGSCCRRR